MGLLCLDQDVLSVSVPQCRFCLHSFLWCLFLTACPASALLLIPCEPLQSHSPIQLPAAFPMHSYLDERLGVFKSMKFDPELESQGADTKESKLKSCNAAELLEKLPQVWGDRAQGCGSSL